ncbi:MAG: hypothetical protein HBSIN02_07990 [Bacteroidia bacterium]|nr:MAG: hypothetical protein HBSIN02_07990 [Bacteroidia bacterium]
MTYRVLVTKTLDVPKNLFHGVAGTEEEAKTLAQEKLVELDGDVAVVSIQKHGVVKVLHTFERIKKAG